MATKDLVLAELEKAMGGDVSGEELAAALGLSRAAVWKAIRALREEGLPIQAAPNRGYRLPAGSDVLSARGIAAWLGDPEAARLIHVYPELESTNLTAKRLAAEGAPAGTAVLAERQTAGRGRRGRRFYSPPGGGVYLTVVLRPEQLTTANAALITTAASVAVGRAVEEVTGCRPEIKWVNDLFFQGKKICGILTEAVTDCESGTIEHVVVGAGVNLYDFRADCPPEVREVAGGLLEGPVPGITRNRLAAAMIRQMGCIGRWIAERSYLEEYRQRSMVLGRRVAVVRPDGREEPARALGIDDAGGLVVEKPDGTRETLRSGEISIRRLP